MRAFRTVVVLLLALALSAPVLAADFQAGLEAYKRGDYVLRIDPHQGSEDRARID